MGGAEGGASWNFKKAAKRIVGSFCCGHQQSYVGNTSNENRDRNISCKKISSEITGESDDAGTTPSENLCSICLDPLNHSTGQAVFTAQCSHAFHFSCISSNVRYGSVTCPICRARWTQLPRGLNTGWSIQDSTKTDPILQIIDEYIATSREHRLSFRRSTHYDDVGPLYPDHTSDQPRVDVISTLSPNS